MLAGADLVTPDGMPLVWALRTFGLPDASRVAGLTLTLTILERAAAEGVRVGFYGGTQQTLDRLVLGKCHPPIPDLAGSLCLRTTLQTAHGG